MKFFSFNLDWDSLAVMTEIKKTLIDLGFKDEKGKPLDNNLTMGMNDKGESAFLIYAYKKTLALRIIAEHQTSELEISSGSWNQKTVSKIEKKNFDTKTDLLKASKHLEEIVKV